MRKFGFLAFFAAPLLLSGAAQAEPQMLGVIQTASAVPLHCDGGDCRAELTSICLHQARATPTRGYPYSAFNPDAISVEGTRADGTPVRLNAAEVLLFAAGRGFTTVQVSLRDGVAEREGFANVSVRVERPLTLVPDAEVRPHDDNPLTEADVEIGAGPLRTTAEAVVDADVDTMHASQVLARMIDVLPGRGRAGTAQRAELWDTAAAPHTEVYSRTGVHRARTAYNRCYRVTRIGDKTLRGCLAEAHDEFVRDLNVKYWDTVKAGF
jgi:hypothetical protein